MSPSTANKNNMFKSFEQNKQKNLNLIPEVLGFSYTELI
jgi:hypothetical protein